MSLRNSNVKIKIPKLLKDKLKNKKINKIYNDFFNQQNINFEILSTHKIKNYSPKKEHIEIQYKITKNSN